MRRPRVRNAVSRRRCTSVSRRELELLEDLRVGQERDRRAGLVRDPDRLHLALRDAARELLPVDLAVALDLGDEPLRERVHDRDADAVQAAGDLVALAAELAAGVELRQDDRERRQALLLDHVDRDAAAAVAHGDRVVGVDRDLDRVVVARHRLVDGVVDDLVDEVVEAAQTGRADVHPGPQADGLEALEDRDVLCGVGRLRQEVFAIKRKALQNSGFAGCRKCIRPGGPRRAARGPN